MTNEEIVKEILKEIPYICADHIKHALFIIVGERPEVFLEFLTEWAGADKARQVLLYNFIKGINC